ncbi:MAG: ATP-dependent Clp protease adapter ClpS [Mariprofundaceae bacterium]|nr:ATP-dependent Clp protease adapter ClpS [Mariprofundaceae bacterium]
MSTTIHITPDIQTEKPALKKPPMYKVIMLNDDYTPMNFVVELLTQFFHHDNDSANRIMMSIHQTGVGICGIYPKDIAESKVMKVEAYCRKHGHPLCCCVEKESEES